MRSIYLAAGAAGIISLFAACGGDDKPGTLPEGGGSTGRGGKKSINEGGDIGDEAGEGGTGIAGSLNRAGTGPMAAGSGGTGGTGMNANGPVVEITSPEESRDIDGEILVDSTVTVVCSVAKSDSPLAVAVDPASVRIGIQDATGKEISEKDAVGTQNAGEYSADFPLVAVPAGKVSFSCKASDKNQNASTTSISTFVDHGPLITVSSPEPGSAHPLDDLAIQFFVDESPLNNGDDAAEVGDVTFTFDGKEFDVTEDSPGKYSTTLPLYNIDLFPEAPQGAITITAANKRKPKSAIAVKTYSILVDGTGPAISIASPQSKQVVGGTVTLAFTVTDAGAGVDPNTVYVTLFSEDPPRFFDPKKGWARNGDNFTFAFDSKLIEAKAPVQTTINVQASDMVGNRSASGQSVQVYLDNLPPKVDLDPRDVRARRGGACSGAFDPVGPAVPDDLAGAATGGITAFEWFRVFVDEQAPKLAGQDVLFASGTQQSEVRLYVQSQPELATTKLLVSKNPGVDNTCDDIGGVDSLVNPPLFTAMRGLPKTPEPPKADYDSTYSPSDPKCTTEMGGDATGLCGGFSDLVVIPYNDPLKEPFLYAVGEANPSDITCAGIDLAFLTSAQPDGWVCLAARAIDKVGNVGISPPLRVCVDDPAKAGTPACAIMSTTPPTCTDGCTPPARGGGFVYRTE